MNSADVNLKLPIGVDSTYFEYDDINLNKSA